MRTEIKIGHLIRETMRNKGLTNRWLAEAIHVDPRTVNKIFNKEIIDTRQLMLISKALGVDFFKFYSEVLEQD